MHMSFRMGIAAVTLGFYGLSGTGLAAKMDAIVGDWKLNAAKSKFNPEPAMQAFETKVTDAGDGKYSFISDWIEGDGTPGHLTFTSALDGKLATVTGYVAVDSVKAKRINASTVKAVFTKNGKVVERETQTMSADGKTVPNLDTGKDENGKPFADHLVLERQ